MALPQFWRWVLVNNSGVDLTFTGGGRITIREAGLNDDTTNGLTDYNVQADDDLGFTTGTLADGAEIVGDVERDNTIDKFTGSQGEIEVTHDGGTAANGTFDLYVSTGFTSGNLQSNASGYLSAKDNKLDFVQSLNWTAAALNGEKLVSNLFHIG